MLKFVKVEEVPEVTRRYHNRLQTRLNEFMESNVKTAKVEDNGHYKNSHTCAEAMRVAIGRGGFPIKVVQRKDEVYLVRRDI